METQHQECLRITWDLRLHPAALEEAFWQDNAELLKRNDFNLITRFHLVGLMALSLSLYPKLGHSNYWESFWHFWLTYMLWSGLIKLAPEWYKRHRLPIVWVMRLLVLSSTELSLGRASVAMEKIGVYPDWPVMTLVVKAVFASNAFHHFLESNALLLPYTHNVFLVVLKALVVLSGRYMRAAIDFANTPQYLEAAAWLNHSWQALLKSPVSVNITRPRTLDGRSTDMLLCLTIIHITPVFLACYVLYITHLVAVKMWIKDQLVRAVQQQQDNASTCDVMCIGGTYISMEQLVALHSSPGAVQALVDALGGRSKNILTSTAVLGIHAIVVGLLCQVALLLSQVLVYWVFPAMIGGNVYWMQQFYPLLPEAMASVYPAADKHTTLLLP